VVKAHEKSSAMTHALYDRIGVGYAERRRPDKRIAAQINSALERCHSVLNVGAGAGSYEPADRFVVAAEPSAEMIGQRPRGAAPAVQASARRLPFRDLSFDAALAILTIHHWPSLGDGLAEMRRVARQRVAILTWDPEHLEDGSWFKRNAALESMSELDIGYRLVVARCVAT
jgi:ubiquinone/menaquinone biosynthesis C-methylase UbiE